LNDEPRILLPHGYHFTKQTIGLLNSTDRPHANTIERLRSQMNRDHVRTSHVCELQAQAVRIGDLKESARLDEDAAWTNRLLNDCRAWLRQRDRSHDLTCGARRRLWRRGNL